MTVRDERDHGRDRARYRGDGTGNPHDAALASLLLGHGRERSRSVLWRVALGCRSAAAGRGSQSQGLLVLERHCASIVRLSARVSGRL